MASLAVATIAWLAPGRDDAHREGSSSDLAPSTPGPPPPSSVRPFVRGNGFPGGVIALTWDDGPDAETTTLARYLHGEHVSGTFFVVGGWTAGVSMEPGTGTHVFDTGYEPMPVLGDLVALGHRLGGHTRNHVVLEGTDAPLERSIEQLMASQRATDPFLTNELRMFRAPGGAWGARSTQATQHPFFDDPTVVGPVHWDVDVHDWDASLYARGAPVAETEPGPLGPRLRAEVMARRYLAAIEETRRGIVLLHDRVGHVGSRYALDLARTLIPALVARRYVFAAPVLAFSPPRSRYDLPSEGRLVALTDIDGDGRADACRRDGDAISCATSSIERDGPDAVARVGFRTERLFARLPDGTRSFAFAPVRGRGAADLCVLTEAGIDCQRGPAGPLERWLTFDAAMPGAHTMQLGDLDGDGRADACYRVERRVMCASSTGATFEAATLWATVDGRLGTGPGDGPELVLADVDGDHRSDACLASSTGLTCALSNGGAFGPMTPWAPLADFDPSVHLHFGDLNGDGRSDVCATSATSVRCALSDGHAFKRASTWSTAFADDLELGDLGGDGRADLCFVARSALVCGMAP